MTSTNDTENDLLDLECRFAVLRMLVQTHLSLHFLNRPDPIQSFDRFSRHISEQLSQLQWLEVSQTHSDHVADLLAVEMEKLLSVIRNNIDTDK